MKTRTFIAVSIFIIVAFVLIGGGSKKEITIEEAMEALCHTWINTDYPPNTWVQKIVVYPDGRYVTYDRAEFPLDTPAIEKRITIEVAWTDRAGNIWFKATLKRWNRTEYVINRIDESGTAWEYIDAWDDYPEDIIPDAPKYRIRYSQ
jgi:phage baseplate assembly protein gpV